MSSLVNKIRRMSYKGDDQHDENFTHAGFAVTAKNMSIVNKGSKVKSSKKEIVWHVGLCAKDCQITCIDSIMSGRKQIFLNNVKVHDVRIPKSQTQWGHVIVVGNFNIEVRLNGDGDGSASEPRYDLLINKIPYSLLNSLSLITNIIIW